MLQCVFLVSDSGEVMLEKQMAGHRVDRSICSWYWDYVILHGGDPSKILHVIASPTHYLFQVFRDGIVFLACTQREMSPLLVIELLSRIADVLTEYLGSLNEDIIKDNFVIVYEILDEMMDNGFPLTTEPNILKEMITPPNIVSKMLNVVTGKSSIVINKLPDATASCAPWRTETKSSSNEVYVNLVEELDACVNREGVRVKCEVCGEIQVNCYLSGLPDLTLSFANPSILNNVMFHPCVRFRPWEVNQVLSFVPPEGLFRLMSYRVKKLRSIPIYVKPHLTSVSGNCGVNVMVGVHNDPGKIIDSIVVQFQLPLYSSSAELTSNVGTVDIIADKTCCWEIGQMPKDKTPSLTGNIVLQAGVECSPIFPTFRVKFRIMGVALSGLQIDRLDVRNTPTPVYKGFRAQTQAGIYEVRS